jgi:CRISPR-associated protein Cas1
MGRSYYIFKSGTLSREQNTVYFENAEGKRPIPVEDIDALFLFGEVTLNSKFLDFLDKHGICAHFFDYYENYSGSFVPRQPKQSGFLLVQQVQHYLSAPKRLAIAREIVSAATDNILRNLKYYKNRIAEGSTLEQIIAEIEAEQQMIPSARDTMELMALEGRIRESYYQGFNVIVNLPEPFQRRERRPPTNPINALISFGNSLLYATTLSEIYRTQLNPTVSFLHEPSARRYSLSLDLSEIFKPIIVDRTIFKLVNERMIQMDDFDRDLNYCYLKEPGRKTFVQEYESRLQQTIEHRKLKKHVSYRHLIRLECYKLVKHLVGEESYEGFRMWW